MTTKDAMDAKVEALPVLFLASIVSLVVDQRV
jgi:hypothetical protein